VAKIIFFNHLQSYEAYLNEKKIPSLIENHKNIVHTKKYHEQDFGKDGKMGIIFMEYCKKGSLIDVL